MRKETPFRRDDSPLSCFHPAALLLVRRRLPLRSSGAVARAAPSRRRRRRGGEEEAPRGCPAPRRRGNASVPFLRSPVRRRVDRGRREGLRPSAWPVGRETEGGEEKLPRARSGRSANGPRSCAPSRARLRTYFTGRRGAAGTRERKPPWLGLLSSTESPQVGSTKACISKQELQDKRTAKRVTNRQAAPEHVRASLWDPRRRRRHQDTAVRREQ